MTCRDCKRQYLPYGDDAEYCPACLSLIIGENPAEFAKLAEDCENRITADTTEDDRIQYQIYADRFWQFS